MMSYDLKLEHTISKEMSIFDTYYSDVLSDPLYKFDVDTDVVYIEAGHIECELEDVIVKRFRSNDIETFNLEIDSDVKFHDQFIETTNDVLHVENEFLIHINITIKMKNNDYKLLVIKDNQFIEMIKDSKQFKEYFEYVLS